MRYLLLVCLDGMWDEQTDLKYDVFGCVSQIKSNLFIFR